MSYTCPRCMTSHHPNDEAEGYCGACHEFTAGTVFDRAFGAIAVDPPLSGHGFDGGLNGEVGTLRRFMPAAYGGFGRVRPTGEETRLALRIEPSDDGRFVQATEIHVRHRDSAEQDADAIGEELQLLVDSLPEHRFAGSLELIGTDGARARICVVEVPEPGGLVGRQVMRIDRIEVWPDPVESAIKGPNAAAFSALVNAAETAMLAPRVRRG